MPYLTEDETSLTLFYEGCGCCGDYKSLELALPLNVDGALEFRKRLEEYKDELEKQDSLVKDWLSTLETAIKAGIPYATT